MSALFTGYFSCLDRPELLLRQPRHVSHRPRSLSALEGLLHYSFARKNIVNILDALVAQWVFLIPPPFCINKLSQETTTASIAN